MSIESIARQLNVPTELVIECSDGYAIVGQSRSAALCTAGEILAAFHEDPEAGLPMLRVTTGWRGYVGHTVRVSVSR
jgi:hypothetical protein